MYIPKKLRPSPELKSFLCAKVPSNFCPAFRRPLRTAANNNFSYKVSVFLVRCVVPSLFVLIFGLPTLAHYFVMGRLDNPANSCQQAANRTPPPFQPEALQVSPEVAWKVKQIMYVLSALATFCSLSFWQRLR